MMNARRRGQLKKLELQLIVWLGELESIKEEEEESRENMPDNLNGSERYELSEEASQDLEDAYDSIEEAINALSNITEQ